MSCPGTYGGLRNLGYVNMVHCPGCAERDSLAEKVRELEGQLADWKRNGHIYLTEHLASERAARERAEEALQKAAVKFREYERLHREKAALHARSLMFPAGVESPVIKERHEKAADNAAMAEMCEAALTPSAPKPEETKDEGKGGE